MFLHVKIARCKNITNRSTGELNFANCHARMMITGLSLKRMIDISFGRLNN